MLERLGKKKLLEEVKELFSEAVAADTDWQRNARESFKFRDNDQWSEEEKSILEEAKRPHLTFNITKSHIDLIMGINEDQRKRFVCTPVSVDDSFRCDILNDIISILYEKNDWIDEEDAAFESAVICGRGWVSIDFDIDVDRYNRITITETNIPIHEVRRDPASRKADLSDASYIIWDKWLSIEDFIVKYPKMKNKVIEAFATGRWPVLDTLQRLSPENADWPSGDLNDVSDYEDALDIEFYDTKKRQIRVAHMEYWKNVDVYWVRNPETGEWEKVTKDWKFFKEEFNKIYPGKELEYEKRITKEVWWLQFSGDEILFNGKSPIAYKGFNIIPCFLYGDVSRRNANHFGIVELMKDAQREINKRVSQTLNLLNQQVQPGVYAEVRAFINKDQAEASMKEAGAITWLNDGAIQGQRFLERNVPTFPSAIMQMEQFAQEIVRRITGINPDLMGQNDKRQEPGIVVQLRQQQGMTILKPVFKSYERMKRELFRRQISIITQHMPLRQIAQILGQGDRYVIDENVGTIEDTSTNLICNIKDLRTLEYDIDGEPEGASLTKNMMELAVYTEMQKNGFPVDPAVIISKTNLPMSEKIGWIQYIENQSKSQSEQAQQQFALEKQKLDQLHQRELVKLKLDAMIASKKIENQQEKDHLKASVDQVKIDNTRERDMKNLTLKTLEYIAKVSDGKKESAEKLLNLMIDSQADRRKVVMQLVDTFIKAKKDIAVANIKAKAMKKMGKSENESSNKTK